jgi:hypothetical protein
MESKYKINDMVESINSYYEFQGTVVAVFKKLSGEERYVIEDTLGVLHVYSGKILRKMHATIDAEDRTEHDGQLNHNIFSVFDFFTMPYRQDK